MSFVRNLYLKAKNKFIKSEHSPIFLLELYITDSKSEKTALAFLKQESKEVFLKKKTITTNQIEIAFLIRPKNDYPYYVNSLLSISGVKKATVTELNSDTVAI